MRLENFNYNLSNALLWGNCRAHFHAYKEKRNLNDLFLTIIEALPIIGQGISLLETGYYSLRDRISARQPTPQDIELHTFAITVLESDSESESELSFDEAMELFKKENSLFSIPRMHWESMYDSLGSKLITDLIFEDKVEKGEVRRCFPPEDIIQAQIISDVKRVDTLKRALNPKVKPSTVSEGLRNQFEANETLDSIPQDLWDDLLDYYENKTIDAAIGVYTQPRGIIPKYEKVHLVLYYAKLVGMIDAAISASRSGIPHEICI